MTTLNYSEALAILSDFADNWDREPYINELEFMADDIIAHGCKTEADILRYLCEIAGF